MVGSHIAHYQIRRQVGEGGMGVVYEAIDDRDGQRVAIKVMRAEFTRSREALTRFFNEARATNLVEHSAMVRIHEHGQIADGTAYLAMEFLQGDTLSARLRRYRGPMPEAEVRRISFQLASGLASAHKKSIVHRDLKPGNIMLVPDASLSSLERVKLLDFGIAKLDTASLNLEDPLTRTGALMGTPHYMSPEQCRGVAGVDDRADVYSLGVIMFQMLTGRLPFIGDGEGTVMAMHIYEPAPKPRDLVPAVTEVMQDLILQMLTKDRAGRPSMFLVMRRLEELGGSEGVTSDLSVTFQEAPETVRGPGEEEEEVEPATLMRMPTGSGARSAASTMMITPSANRSSPSLSGNGSSPSIPSTLGPVTGQVGTITRYSRPLLAGVAGACGLLAVVGLAVLLLRRPNPPQAQIRVAHSNSNSNNVAQTVLAVPSGGEVTPPLRTLEPKDPDHLPPTVGTDTPSLKPVVQRPPLRRAQPISRGKNRYKRHPVKHKGKGKGKASLASKAGKTKSVSVVD